MHTRPGLRHVIHMHESSEGPSSTTKPKPRGNHPMAVPTQAHLYITMQKAEPPSLEN